MRTVRIPLIAFCLAGLLLALSGCGAPATLTAEPAAAIEPTVIPATTTPVVQAVTPTQAVLSEAELVERALAAVYGLQDLPGFSFKVQSSSLTRIKITSGDQTLDEGTHLDVNTDAGARLKQGEGANIVLQRKIYFPGSNLYPMNGEMRQVDGQVYLRAAFNQPKADLPVMPQGWLRVNGESTLLYWPNLRDLAMGRLYQNMRQDPWALLSGYPADVTAEVLAGRLERAQGAAVVMPDGSAGEVITFTIQSSALPQTIRYLDRDDPVNARAISAVQGSPITMQFTLDEAGRLAAWQQVIKLKIQDLDIGGLSGAPEGARLAGEFEQDVAVTTQIDASLPPAAAPAADEFGPLPAYTAPEGSDLFKDLEDFDRRLNQAISAGKLDSFWQELGAAQAMPLVFGDLAVLLYRGQGQRVNWLADWSSSRLTSTAQLQGSLVWLHTVRLPQDARLEYQIQVDDKEPVLDPLNPQVEVGGLGSKSVVCMPGCVEPGYLIPVEETAAGALTEDLLITSQRLGYMVNYRVYTPAGVESLGRLPVLYVTDGQDFLAFGRLELALDNLIAAGKIRPVMAVFIDPRAVETGENQRELQFLDNPLYGQFIAEELVPEIDRAYPTDPSPEARLILGASYGGYHSLYFALNHADAFHLVAAFSPSIWHNPQIIETYRQGEVLPLKFFLSSGVFNDADYHSRLFQEMLREKGYPSLYLESNAGHSYGNWRGKFAEMLEYFFPVEGSS